jgi:hypothetical protein
VLFTAAMLAVVPLLKASEPETVPEVRPTLRLAYASDVQSGSTTSQQQPPEQVQEIPELEEFLKEEKEEPARPFFRLDSRDVVLTGFAFSNFRVKDETKSRTSLGLNPVLLWKINDRLFFESEVEITWSSASDETVTEVEYFNLSYLVNDYLTVVGGKFLVPFGLFSERLHPSWINKLPDAPLPLGHDGLVPGAGLGLMGRGAFSAGVSKFNYAAYAVFGPDLVTEGGEAGRLNFEHGSWNWRNDESNDFTELAFGARVGYLPVPNLEFGYSLYAAPNLQSDMDVLVQGVDASYNRDYDALKGNVDLRFEWLWSRGESRFYGNPGSYFTFDNHRNGGYVQLAYRPSKVEDRFLKNLETVVRYDRLTQPERSGGSEQRVTLGLNYWLKPNMAIKLAYQIDDKRGDRADQNAFFIEFAWRIGDALGALKR